jgi:hypothetical protein
MAGSLKWFPYTDDDGAIWALRLDESNTEACNGDVDYTGTPVLTNSVPRNVRPRFAVYASPDGARNLRITILTPELYQGLAAATPIIPDPFAAGGILRLVRQRPEQRRLPVAGDTGLNDGDVS